MRSLPPGLAASLAGGATTLCHCWRIERRDGAVLGFTDHDRPLAFGGASYEPDTGADGARLVSTADLAVDNSEIAGALASARLSAADLAAGRYDGAALEIWRVDWSATDNRVLLKKGVLGEVTREGDAFTAELRGPGHALSRPVGRVYQRQCDAVVGDARCGVDLETAAFRGMGSVAAAIDEHGFRAAGLAAFAAGWFRHGVLAWETGANAGGRAHVKTHKTGAPHALVELWLPAGRPIVVGDAFTITAGCDRRHTTCRDKFDNLVNFRGHHLMPGDDAAISYPVRTGNNDGGRR